MVLVLIKIELEFLFPPKMLTMRHQLSWTLLLIVINVTWIVADFGCCIMCNFHDLSFCFGPNAAYYFHPMLRKIGNIAWCGKFYYSQSWAHVKCQLPIIYILQPGLGPPRIKCRLLISSILMQWISNIFRKYCNIICSISKKWWKFISSKMLVIKTKSRHLTWVGPLWATD